MNKIFTIFDKYPELQIAFSTKVDGNLRIKEIDDQQVYLKILQTRTKFLTKIGLDPVMVAQPILEHGNNVLEITESQTGQILSGFDALITNQPGLVLSLTVADCLPIFLFDPNKKAIALVHAGWRGLTNGIIAKTIKEMAKIYETNPEDLLVGIGPAICVNHYEVKIDVAAHFPDTCLIKKNQKIFLDLKKTATEQLISAGLLAVNIELNSECTYELSEKYFSYRRDKPELLEAMLAVFSMRK